ncbi:MAG: hypothetical protein KBS91_04130 [Firmicutes bacterium]|nr:hypothetical protein [Candidatus Caballimonas caccae]
MNYYSWENIAVKPYDKKETAPYTKARIILMNGTEFESNWFLHQFNRNCLNNDIRRKIAMVRRQEQQQQKLIASLKPLDESMLETTISYEQLAVDLTAEMAQKEVNPFVKEQLDFALLEDFDHVYRYSNLLDMEEGIDAKTLVGGYTEITPGRPTIAEHRHPNDDVRHYINDWRDSLLTRLHTHTITAAEQQTMNFYMNVANLYPTQLGRELYTEIAMIEEQHVTGYGSLMDPSCTWLENWVFHEYTECYLYYSCYEDESDKRIKNIWKMHFEQELTHLKIASETLRQYEGRAYQQLFPEEDFPSLIKLKQNIEYVRKVMNDVRLTGDKESYKKIDFLKDDAEYFNYQKQVNNNLNNVATHKVIQTYIDKNGQDYRFEVKPNPEKTLRNRKEDNIDLGRVKGK